MKLLHFTSDLMLGSQVNQAARGRGIAVEQIQQLERLFERIDETTGMVVIDLQSRQWMAEKFQELRKSKAVSVRFIAYAQHVFPELLVAAQKAGIDEVFTRGQFAKSIPDLMERLSSIDA